MCVGSLGGSVAVVAGSLTLRSAWTKGQLLIAIGLLGYTLTGVTTAIFAKQAGSTSRFLQPTWGRYPRAVWVLGAVGVFFALTNVAFAFLPHP
jgi:hypothetical protein